jgi:hypothetical protein
LRKKWLESEVEKNHKMTSTTVLSQWAEAHPYMQWIAGGIVILALIILVLSIYLNYKGIKGGPQ